MDARKIASYLTIILGIIIILIVFFLRYRGFEFTTRNDQTLFVDVMDGILDLHYRDHGFYYFLWWLLLISFTYSWWSLRNKITDLLLKFHKKV
jgi:hypothetical protein